LRHPGPGPPPTGACALWRWLCAALRLPAWRCVVRCHVSTSPGSSTRGVGRDSLCPRVCLPGPRTGHSGATSLHGRTESNAVRKEGLYHSARSPRGNRYIITPRGSYIDYSIENDSLTATSDGVCPPRPPPLRMLLRGPSCRISRAGSPLKYALRSAGRVLYLETEAADTSENKRHAG